MKKEGKEVSQTIPLPYERHSLTNNWMWTLPRPNVTGIFCHPIVMGSIPVTGAIVF
uniref:Uncharacterized protein n=1 Tax=viral metagenome TaxID=1070528 RepID=A0A6H1ZYS5_9ZZZZ